MPYIQIFMDKEISIHAPREGCDVSGAVSSGSGANFNPRTP